MGLELAGVEVRGASWTQRCATTVEHASAYVVSVITVLPDRTVGLVSVYVADLAGETAVTHMRLPPTGPSTFEQRVLSGLTGTSRARACVLDHAAELRGILEHLLQEPVTVEVPETALHAAEDLWS